MAMTGGKSYLVRSKKTNYGNNNWTVDLYVYVKEESQSVANNQTVLSLGMYVVTPSGYDIGEWNDWNSGSYVGTTSNTFNGTIPNFSGTRWLVENKKMTVTHSSDGKGSATIYWKWAVNSPWGQYVNPSGSFTHTITTIPRATQPTVSAPSSYMGTSITISMPRASSAFTHTLTYSMGNQSGTIGSGLGTSKSWTVPYSLANAIPNAKSGTCTITCKTYSGSTLIGTKTVTFTATVPDDSNTRPSVSCSITPVSSLGEAFAGLYIQGLTKVKTEITASGKYKAGIASYFSTVANTGETYSPSGAVYTHSYPVSSGQTKVVYTAYDTRGIGNTGVDYINVLPYARPAVVPFTGETAVICARCDEDGNLSSSGTYLRIEAGRKYSRIESGGKQLNHCILRYRYKASTSDTYSSWVTLIDKASTSDLVAKTISGVVSSVATSYDVQINAIDDIGQSHTITFDVPTDKVNFHEREGGDGAAFGKYSERAKALEIAEDWELVVNGDRWKKLSFSSAVSTSDRTDRCTAPGNDAVYYRVENGNHVYVAFNCAFSFTGNQIRINSELIPAEYRPANGVSRWCAAGNGLIATKMFINSSGEIVMEYAQVLNTGQLTTSLDVAWIDGYIDYFISP
jgi:hypothetical protein